MLFINSSFVDKKENKDYIKAINNNLSYINHFTKTKFTNSKYFNECLFFWRNTK